MEIDAPLGSRREAYTRGAGRPRVLAAIITGILCSGLALAGVGVWTGNGPDGGRALQIAIDPSLPSVLYLVSDAGELYRTSDAAAHWSPIQTGVARVVLDPKTPSTLYAVAGSTVLKSEDRGETWKHSGGGLPDGLQIFALAVAPSDPSILYLSSLDLPASGIWKSSDAGATWTKTPFFPDVGSITVDPRDASTFYALVEGGFLNKSTDGGTTSVILAPVPSVEISSFLMDPGDPSVLFAAVGVSGLSRSTDAGASWTLARAALPPFFLRLFSNPAEPSRIYAATETAIYASADHGDSWFPIPKDNVLVESVAFDPRDSSTLYVVSFDDVLESQSGSPTWREATNGFSATRIGSIGVSPNGTVFASSSTTVSRSRNGGGSWEEAGAGLPGTAVHLATVAGAPERAYASDGKAIFRTDDAGDFWQILSKGTALASIVVDPERPSLLYGTGRCSGVVQPSVCDSTDGGRTWFPGLTLSKDQSLDAVAVDPASSSNVYAAGSGIFKSEDFGRTWRETLTVDFPFPAIRVLAVSPASSARLFASDGGEIFRSDDAGDHWCCDFPPLSFVPARTLVLDPADPDVLYAAGGFSLGQGFVSRSTDGGRTWTDLSAGLAGVDVASLALSPDGRTLHAGTDGRGVLELDLPFLNLDPDRRFSVALSATDPRTGKTGMGLPVRQNDLFGYFSIPDLTGDPENPEVFVKVLDGRAVNGDFWVFYGGLTDLQYTLTVTENATGRTRQFEKEAFSPCGGFAGDAFSDALPASSRVSFASLPAPRNSSVSSGARGSCATTSGELCLDAAHPFRVALAARDQRTGTSATGLAIPQNDLFGYFSLPGLTGDPGNPEVFVKILDGTNVNGSFWVFYGGLTDLEYLLTVTDVAAGASRTYRKEAGSACGGFDTTAFP